MKRLTKILLLFLVLAIVSQVPFAYRRYKLSKLFFVIQQREVAISGVPSPDDKFVEYVGVSHVHSSLGGHSPGTFEEIIRAAKANGLDFVLMTEHTSSTYNTAALTLQGVYNNVLFVNGNELALSNSDRLLIMPGPTASQGALSESDFLKYSQEGGAVSFVAYPQEFKGWANTHYDGIEVYNLYTNSRTINPVVMFFDALWARRNYTDLLFANFYERPNESLAIWDQNTAAGERLSAIAGVDAHANVGLSLNDASGHTILGFTLDPYERTFRLARIHVLIPKDQQLNRDTLLAALRAGHCYIAFDIFGGTSGFRLTATNGQEEKIQGDEIGLTPGLKLNIRTGLHDLIVLFKDGKRVHESVSTMEYPVTEKGVFRAEIYANLPGRMAQQPLILSNPIYVR